MFEIGYRAIFAYLMHAVPLRKIAKKVMCIKLLWSSIMIGNHPDAIV